VNRFTVRCLHSHSITGGENVENLDRTGLTIFNPRKCNQLEECHLGVWNLAPTHPWNFTPLALPSGEENQTTPEPVTTQPNEHSAVTLYITIGSAGIVLILSSIWIIRVRNQSKSKATKKKKKNNQKGTSVASQEKSIKVGKLEILPNILGISF